MKKSIIILLAISIIIGMSTSQKFKSESEIKGKNEIVTIEENSINVTDEPYVELDRLYMIESTVTDISENNIITVTTVNGDMFEFEGNDTWLINDGVILSLDNQGTEIVEDDVIINTFNMQ